MTAISDVTIVDRVLKCMRFPWKLCTFEGNKKGLLLGIEDTGHVTIERRLTNLLFLLFSSFFCPFVLYCFTSSVSSTPSRSRKLFDHAVHTPQFNKITTFLIKICYGRVIWNLYSQNYCKLKRNRPWIGKVWSWLSSKPTHNPQSLHSLWRRASARNVGFITRYGG